MGSDRDFESKKKRSKRKRKHSDSEDDKHKKAKKKKKDKKHKHSKKTSKDRSDKNKEKDNKIETVSGKNKTSKVASKEKKLEMSSSSSSIQGPSPTRRSMIPMTKEEYEKQQSVIRRVYDADTGRTRLVKGDGEIIEEIVSKAQHKAINKQATSGDGQYFQSVLGLHK